MTSEITIDQGGDLVVDPGGATIIIDAPVVIQADAAGGDVIGPAGATDNAPAVFDGVTGKTLKEPDAAIDFLTQAISNVGNVDGRDVSIDGSVLDGHVGSTSNPHTVTPAQVGNGAAQWNADKLHGRDVGAGAPAGSDVLTWNGSAWVPLAPAGGGVSGPVSSTDSAIALWNGVDGDLLKDSAVTVDGDGNITVQDSHITDSGGILQLGGAMSTSHGLGVGDVGAAGDFEVDGAFWADSISTFTGIATFSEQANFNGGSRFNDNAFLSFGTTANARMAYKTEQNPDSLVLGLSTDSRALIITEKADMGFNFAHPQQPNPTLFGQSANQSTTEWWSLAHNQTKAVLSSGAGSVKLAAANSIVEVDKLEAGDGIGFFGQTAPAARPAVTGSRSGATVSVLTQLLTALSAAGIIDDQTTA